MRKVVGLVLCASLLVGCAQLEPAFTTPEGADRPPAADVVEKIGNVLPVVVPSAAPFSAPLTTGLVGLLTALGLILAERRKRSKKVGEIHERISGLEEEVRTIGSSLPRD